MNHLGLLFASCGPAFLLSISLRSISLRRCTFGIPQHAYYIPFYLLLIPILFWITIAGLQYTDKAGMDMLVRNGWLFSIDDSVKTQSGIGSAWIYWTLFDFSKVDLHALKNATTNIILLVVIGVLNLPIYVPALGSSLGISVNMNHEFIGQGVANILAGLAGTVPNILVSLKISLWKEPCLLPFPPSIAAFVLYILYPSWRWSTRSRPCHYLNICVLSLLFLSDLLCTHRAGVYPSPFSRY